MSALIELNDKEMLFLFTLAFQYVIYAGLTVETTYFFLYFSGLMAFFETVLKFIATIYCFIDQEQARTGVKRPDAGEGRLKKTRRRR